MNKMLGIKDVVEMSGLSEVYVRRSISQGKLKVTKGFVGESRIPKNFVKIEDFETWRESIVRTKREDGRNKFVIYLNDAEREQLVKMIEELEFGKTLVRANLKTNEE